MKTIPIKLGEKFGRLTVIGDTELKKVRCRCDCGNERSVSRGALRRSTRSCGCILKEVTANRNRTHGLAYSKEYGVWRAVKDRCLLVTNDAYPYYGGRGIKICERWLNSFDNFYADMGPRPSNKHSIDRTDVNGDYCPENCRWATLKEQHVNKRNTILHFFQGVRLPLRLLSEAVGVPYGALRGRIDIGWTAEESLATPKGVSRGCFCAWSPDSLLRYYNKDSEFVIRQKLKDAAMSFSAKRKVIEQ